MQMMARLWASGALVIQGSRRAAQRLVTAGLVVCCSTAPEEASIDSIPKQTQLKDLSAEEVDQICRWQVDLYREVECPEVDDEPAYVATIGAASFEGCVGALTASQRGCTATVAQLEECTVFDPCDDGVQEACAPLAPCSNTTPMFQCDDGLGSVLETAVCDGNPDCLDGSDEQAC